MNRLTEKHFSFKCPMNWAEMEPSANGRFCSQCRKEVFDLTNCSIDEVRDLKQKHGSICGSIRVAQVAAVAISLSAAACKEDKPKAAGAANPTPATPVQVVPPETMIMGEICLPPTATPPNPAPAAPNDK